MDYVSAFNISASGMAVEKTRLEIMAINLANANSSRAKNGEIYKPLKVITAPKSQVFESILQNYSNKIPAGVEVVDIVSSQVNPRLVKDPGHPHADENGFVAYPSVNTVTEMVSLIEATRAYEANVKALNAAKSMALRALEIGSQR